MKLKKIVYYLVYFIFVLLLTYHFGLFFSLFFPESTLSFVRPIFLLGQMTLTHKIIYCGLLLLSVFLSFLIAFQSNHMEKTLSLTFRNCIIRFAVMDILFFALIISPVFYTYDDSFLYSVTENEKMRYYILFLCVLCLISYLFWYYINLYVKKKTLEHQELRQRIASENELLKKQLNEDNNLLEKWQMDIEKYSERLNKIEGITPETTEYYDSIRNSFKALKSKEDQI